MRRWLHAPERAPCAPPGAPTRSSSPGRAAAVLALANRHVNAPCCQPSCVLGCVGVKTRFLLYAAYTRPQCRTPALYMRLAQRGDAPWCRIRPGSCAGTRGTVVCAPVFSHHECLVLPQTAGRGAAAHAPQQRALRTAGAPDPTTSPRGAAAMLPQPALVVLGAPVARLPGSCSVIQGVFRRQCADFPIICHK